MRMNCKQGLKAEVYFYRKREKGSNTHTGSKIGFPWFSKSETIETNLSRNGLRPQKRQLEEGSQAATIEVQCKGGVRAISVSSLIVAAGERRGLLGVGFENMMRSWVMKWGAQQGLGVVASRWLGGRGAQGRGMGWGAIARLAITAIFCLEFAYVFRLSVSRRKVASERLSCVHIYRNFCIFHIYFILFILL